MIYFVQNVATGNVKIGFTAKADASSRVRDMQVGCDGELRVIAACEGSEQDEAAMHARFNEHRVRGEWFRPVEALMTMVRLNQGAPRIAGLAHEWGKSLPAYAREAARKNLLEFVARTGVDRMDGASSPNVCPEHLIGKRCRVHHGTGSCRWHGGTIEGPWDHPRIWSRGGNPAVFTLSPYVDYANRMPPDNLRLSPGFADTWCERLRDAGFRVEVFMPDRSFYFPGRTAQFEVSLPGGA